LPSIITTVYHGKFMDFSIEVLLIAVKNDSGIAARVCGLQKNRSASHSIRMISYAS